MDSEFLNRLIEYWEGCSIGGEMKSDKLFALHIKALKDCDDFESQDLFNGLVLNQKYYNLFKNHLISFDVFGKILLSSDYTESDWLHMGISKHAQINKCKLTINHAFYLEDHRFIFQNKGQKILKHE